MNNDNNNYYAIFGDIGKAIAELRQHSGLTVEQAAAAIEKNAIRVEAIERGRRINSTVELCNIVEALGGRLAIIPTENEQDPHCQFIELEESTIDDYLVHLCDEYPEIKKGDKIPTWEELINSLTLHPAGQKTPPTTKPPHQPKTHQPKIK